MPRVGVIAIQGDFDKHIRAVEAAGGEAMEVRTPEELWKADHAIIPGGESTTVGMLMERFGLGDALRTKSKEGMPIWGTCMGMILMAHEIAPLSSAGSQPAAPKRYTLDLLDVSVQRNAFGAQVHSFEDEVEMKGLQEPVTGIFIRAPIVTRLGPGVEELGRYEGKIVAVRQGNLLGTSFHPELTDDVRLHEWFLRL